ncbi:MAG: PEGA domain-containing protein, partial [Vicingaceae bacterium]|nr:PEGA domain-containing protein [Vicingaceae bacterium]
MKNFISIILLLLGSALISSCGVMFYGAKQKVNVQSTPAGAEVYVNGVSTGQTTPATIKVPRNVKDSPTSEKQKITYTFKKDGFKDYTQVEASKFNVIPLIPDLILTGGIGAIADVAVGATRVYPKTVHVNLSGGSSSSNSGLLIDRSQEEAPTEKTTSNETPQVTENNTKTVPSNDKSNIVDPGSVTIIPPTTKSKEDEPTPGVVLSPENKNNTKTIANTTKQTEHYEPFDNNNNGWPEEDNKKRNYNIADGHYKVVNTTLIKKTIYKRLNELNLGKKNYLIEMRMKQNSDKKTGFYGFNYPITNDTSIEYSFSISPDQKSYTINYTTLKGKFDSKEIAQGNSDAIEGEGEYNTLKIEKIDNTVKFYVNDAVVHKMNNFVISGDIIGISEYVKDGISIDHFKIIKGITSFTPSLIPEKETELASEKIIQIDNYREDAWEEIKANSININSSSNAVEEQPAIVKTEASKAKKLKKSAENIAAEGLKYRRSSLYTLMINDPNRAYSSVIQNSFGDETVPQKFNDHNIGPYYINSIAELKTQDKIIDKYIVDNNVAKMLIAKWFTRNEEGKFDMGLISERGMYDASAMDKVIANSSERGNALLADAGEELISKTFVIINDYKFTSKEELAEKTKKGLNFIKDVSSLAGVDVSGVTELTSAAVTVAGKGYIIKSTSYLYRLVWDEEAAAIFYNNYWTDDNSYDPAKVEAFNKATNFKLKYVGVQSAWADVQSSVFTDKSEEDLVQMATVKATDKAIAKLERKFEEFRTMTPLHSSDPLTAKIGLKEGLEKGDKFEVLQQELTEDGKTVYKRVGVIKVDPKHIWDNTLSEEEIEALKA